MVLKGTPLEERLPGNKRSHTDGFQDSVGFVPEKCDPNLNRRSQSQEFRKRPAGHNTTSALGQVFRVMEKPGRRKDCPRWGTCETRLDHGLKTTHKQL